MRIILFDTVSGSWRALADSNLMPDGAGKYWRNSAANLKREGGLAAEGFELRVQEGGGGKGGRGGCGENGFAGPLEGAKDVSDYLLLMERFATADRRGVAPLCSQRRGGLLFELSRRNRVPGAVSKRILHQSMVSLGRRKPTGTERKE